jgi:hypothetical protein
MFSALRDSRHLGGRCSEQLQPFFLPLFTNVLEEEFCEVAFRPGDSSRIHRHPLGCGRMGMEGQVTIETEVGGVLCQSTMKIR